MPKSKDVRPEYDGAIFYSNQDMSISWNLKKAEESIKKLNKKVEPYNINEILEMFNILKLFDTNIVPDSWDDKHYEKLKNAVLPFKVIIGRFIAFFDYSNFTSEYMLICISYVKSFWDLFELYNMSKQLPHDIFIEFLNTHTDSLGHILSHKKIVHEYDVEIAAFMIEKNQGAELLIDAYLVQHTNNLCGHFFPNSLSREDKSDLIISYIESENPSPNYLDMIVKGKQCKELNLTDRIRLSAKRKYDAYWASHFEKNTGIAIGVEITFADIEEPVSVTLDNPLNPSFTFSSKWISENLDFATLLNNFIYLFGFVDRCYRSSFPNKPANNHSITSFIGLKSSKAYDMRKPRSRRKSDKIMAFTEKEQNDFEKALADYSPNKGTNDCRLQLMISLYSGMRMGEINALTREDIDLKKGVIKVNKTVSQDMDGKPIIKNSAKTEVGVREVPIVSQLVPYLEEAMKNETANTHGLIFYDNKADSLISTSLVNNFFKRVLKKAGIAARGQHCLRHTFATRCIEAGVDSLVLKKWMGHTDIHVTLDTYADVFDSLNNSAIENFNDHIRRIRCEN